MVAGSQKEKKSVGEIVGGGGLQGPPNNSGTEKNAGPKKRGRAGAQAKAIPIVNKGPIMKDKKWVEFKNVCLS